jgi:hypothetical protein
MTAMFRTMKIIGRDMQRFEFDEAWGGLSKVTLSAQQGGRQMGVGVDDLEYEILSAC